MFKVVSQHFEYDFKEWEEVFFIFPTFDPVTVPNWYYLGVNTPDHIVEDIWEESHHVLEDGD